MKSLLRGAALAVAAAATLAAVAPRANAQGANIMRLFRPYHQIVLTQLDEVSADLKLTDEQKQKIGDLYQELNDERGALFQEMAGDFNNIAEDWAKLNADMAAKLNEVLDDAQKTRIAQIYAQTNGPTALFDEALAKELKFTDEQAKKLAQVRDDLRDQWQDVDWQSTSAEDGEKEIDDMIAEQNEAYAAILTEEQTAALEKLQGDKLEVDLKKLPNPWGG